MCRNPFFQVKESNVGWMARKKTTLKSRNPLFQVKESNSIWDTDLVIPKWS